MSSLFFDGVMLYGSLSSVLMAESNGVMSVAEAVMVYLYTFGFSIYAIVLPFPLYCGYGGIAYCGGCWVNLFSIRDVVTITVVNVEQQIIVMNMSMLVCVSNQFTLKVLWLIILLSIADR